MRATDKRCMTQTGQLDIVQKLPSAAHHSIVCHAPLSLTCFCHDRSPPDSADTPSSSHAPVPRPLPPPRGAQRDTPPPCRLAGVRSPPRGHHAPLGATRLAPTALILLYALNPGARSEANEKQKPGIPQYPGAQTHHVQIDMLASDETLPHRKGMTALPTESTHTSKNIQSALRAFKECRARNTKTRYGAHTGSCTECRRICALL
jgi:hypothetical protein